MECKHRPYGSIWKLREIKKNTKKEFICEKCGAKILYGNERISGLLIRFLPLVAYLVIWIFSHEIEWSLRVYNEHKTVFIITQAVSWICFSYLIDGIVIKYFCEYKEIKDAASVSINPVLMRTTKIVITVMSMLIGFFIIFGGFYYLDIRPRMIFGHYEQDNNTSNGEEEIEWIVLEDCAETKTLISRYAIDVKPFNEENANTTWETCSLREWLNGEFINRAFSKKEQAMLKTVTIKSGDSPNYSTDPGNNTDDRVYILSVEEAKKYFGFNSGRICIPTKKAKSEGADTSSFGLVKGCTWWLRTPGYQEYNAAYILFDGTINDYGYIANLRNAVRPVIVLQNKN